MTTTRARPPQGRFTEVELGGGSDSEAALRMKAARVLDHARREIHPGYIESAFGEVGGHRSGPAADVEDRPEPAHSVGEGVDRRLEPWMPADVADSRRHDHVGVVVGHPVVGLTDDVEIGRAVIRVCGSANDRTARGTWG